MASGVTAIAAGDAFSLALQNGGVYAWGFNGVGQLGNGTTLPNYAPMAVVGLSSGVTAIAAGSNHGLAVQNGGVYAWGYNNFGQLGDGTTTSHSAPIAVSGLSSGVTSVAAGDRFSLALQNGNVYAWGFNGAGNLGDGTTITHMTPELIDPTDLHGILSVTAGEGTSYALSSDGSIWAWGLNDAGQVGVGTFQNDYLTPQHVLPPVGYRFTSVDAGALGLHAIATLGLAGDANSDGIVNGLDIATVASHWLNIGVGSPGDTNGDGIINGLDITLIASDWLHTYGGVGGNAGAAVPEPSCLVLAIFGLASVAVWGWRRMFAAPVASH
jgi:hypothetical protein